MEINLSRLNASDFVLMGSVLLPEDDGSGPLEIDGMRFPTPFELEGRARRDSLGLIVVEGHVEGSVSLECGRCLEWFDHAVSLDFESRHREAGPVHPAAARVIPASPGKHHAGDVGVGLDELQDDERHFGPPGEDVVQLPEGCRVLQAAEIVREHVLVAMPLRPLCRVNCKGLCPTCGADRNEIECTCASLDVESKGDTRLAPLAELKKKLERK